ncbi:unnamed protein product [Effrenium voratum]|nr:unnamed protein product [Effrenium voratum]
MASDVQVWRCTADSPLMCSGRCGRWEVPYAVKPGKQVVAFREGDLLRLLQPWGLSVGFCDASGRPLFVAEAGSAVPWAPAASAASASAWERRALELESVYLTELSAYTAMDAAAGVERAVTRADRFERRAKIEVSPRAAKAGRCKERLNELLAEAVASVQLPVADGRPQVLLLDGASGATSAALAVPPHAVLAPNVAPEAAEALRAKGLWSWCGRVEDFLRSNLELGPLRLVYLDHTGCFASRASHLQAAFGSGLLAPGSLFACTFSMRFSPVEDLSGAAVLPSFQPPGWSAGHALHALAYTLQRCADEAKLDLEGVDLPGRGHPHCMLGAAGAVKDRDLARLRTAAAQLRSRPEALATAPGSAIPAAANTRGRRVFRRSVLVYPEEMMFFMVRVTDRESTVPLRAKFKQGGFFCMAEVKEVKRDLGEVKDMVKLRFLLGFALVSIEIARDAGEVQDLEIRLDPRPKRFGAVAHPSRLWMSRSVARHLAPEWDRRPGNRQRWFVGTLDVPVTCKQAWPKRRFTGYLATADANLGVDNESCQEFSNAGWFDDEGIWYCEECQMNCVLDVFADDPVPAESWVRCGLRCARQLPVLAAGQLLVCGRELAKASGQVALLGGRLMLSSSAAAVASAWSRGTHIGDEVRAKALAEFEDPWVVVVDGRPGWLLPGDPVEVCTHKSPGRPTLFRICDVAESRSIPGWRGLVKSKAEGGFYMVEDASQKVYTVPEEHLKVDGHRAAAL